MNLDRAVDRAIARENANPQGLPPGDIAALDVPYRPLEEESRTYVVSLPVSITIQPDGTVIAEVDLSEASDLRDASVTEDMEALPQGFLTSLLEADASIIENAVIQARVEVK